MKRFVWVAALAVAMSADVGRAAFLIEIDTDGADDGPITYNSHFTFGGDTTTASTSSFSDAYGLSKADSLFGGDGVNEPDTYVYRYDPTTDADNLNTAGVLLGKDLTGAPVYGSGIAGGAAGLYRVYVAWPTTSNVNTAGVDFEAVSGSNTYTVHVDQNEPTIQKQANDDRMPWVYLGDINYDGSSGIILNQRAAVNSFVSMRAAAALFEPVPEPTSLALLGAGVGCLGWIWRRRR